MATLPQRLHRIQQARQSAQLADITRGVEKESLRVTPEGFLADTPHPKSLGSALTHPRITTDYSEALLEFITPPAGEVAEPIKTLEQLHTLAYHHISDEYLWVNSMPCMIARGQKIPVARYGSCNRARMKTIYREGLGHRYGSAMQIIAGIHFNFSVSDDFWRFLRDEDNPSLSLQDYKTQGYLALIRNFRRNFWILLYLFGAAPAICRSFVEGIPHKLIPVGDDRHSLHMPYATSLRMGDLGYQSAAQESLAITYNCLQEYSESLCQAITQTHDDYSRIGIRGKDGEYHQLNDSLLQIENEFYSVIRPKRTTSSGQTALYALNTGGIEYIEVRCLDLNPFEPVGINKSQIRFLDLFLLFCLLKDSPLSDKEEYRQQQENQRRMVYEGRDPNLSLYDRGKKRNIRQWGREIIDELTPLAIMLDEHNGGEDYQRSLQNESLKLVDQQLTPSAKILAEMKTQQVTFYRWAMNAAFKNCQHFLKRTLSPKLQQYYREMANQSLVKQAQLEADKEKSFEAFLADYYAQYQCRGTPLQSVTIK